MRILTFTSLFPNASNRVMGVFVYNRMREVNDREDCAVDVVAPVPYSSKMLPVAAWKKIANVPREETIGNLNVYHPRYPLVPKISLPVQGLSMFLSSYALVKRLHRRQNYDCIDAHYVYPDGFAAVLLGKLLDIPVCVSARGSDITLYPTFKQIRPMIKFTLRRADGLVAVSSALAEGMRNLGASGDKLTVIGNGVDSQLFYPVDRSRARQTLGIDEESQLVISVAGLVESKGHDLLLRAVAQLGQRMQRLRLVCIGEGQLRGEIEALIRQLQLESRVSLAGLVRNEDLRTWYSAADVSCLASSREGWPNVILESLACGTPVVGTRVGGIPEVLASPNLGMTVARDASELAAALEIGLKRDWDRKALVAHARTRSWNVVAGEVEVFLESLVKNRRRHKERPEISAVSS